MFTQRSFPGKPFVTHRTYERPSLVITWMLSDIITISFSLNPSRTFSCTSSNASIQYKHVILWQKFYQKELLLITVLLASVIIIKIFTHHNNDSNNKMCWLAIRPLSDTVPLLSRSSFSAFVYVGNDGCMFCRIINTITIKMSIGFFSFRVIQRNTRRGKTLFMKF